MQAIKGESSYWINRQGIFDRRFEWAEEYYAGSVGYSSVPIVRRYIASQQEHHRCITWEEEMETFQHEYGFTMS